MILILFYNRQALDLLQHLNIRTYAKNSGMPRNHHQGYYFVTEAAFAKFITIVNLISSVESSFFKFASLMDATISHYICFALTLVFTVDLMYGS